MTIELNSAAFKSVITAAEYASLLSEKQRRQLDRITEALTVSDEQLDSVWNTLRISAIHLRGNGQVGVNSRKFIVPDSCKINSTGKVLFDYIAECIRQFIDEEVSLPTLERGQTYSLGFTFSYPVHQTAIDHGTLLTWTKGFNLPDVVNKDTIANIGKLNEPDNQQEMIVNTEWGAFDTERVVLPQTRFDARVDRMSPHPFKQPFEKMIGGQYLGELLRLIILDFIDRRLLFDGNSSDEFNQPLLLNTEYLSLMEGDTSPELVRVQHVLESIMGLPAGRTTLCERKLVQRICELISTRSARLCATGLAALLSQRSDILHTQDHITVGIDGSLFEGYPHYAERMTVALEHHLKLAHKVKLTLIKDGSVIGAALACLLAEREQSS
ncbi:hypothetical protein BDF22DRAFT_739661 [Syncephalis plumigaleata]|nr:hypothetical protein BDF22DRAFT_739661 [Syncephalis plumigaleata]